MPERAPFIHKLLKSLDRLDKESLEQQVRGLVQENSLYAEILGQLNEGVLIVRSDGRVPFLNSTATGWLGLEKVNLTKIRIPQDLKDPLLSRFVREHLGDLRTKVVEDFHILLPREMHLKVHMIPLEIPDDKEVFILLTDIREEKNREGELERVARTEALLSLAAGIAHEIGNPLNSLAIHLELLKKAVKNLSVAKRRPLEKTLSVLHTETARLDKTVRNFLKAVRRPPLRFQSHDLNAVLRDTIEFLEPELKGHRITLEFRPDRNLPHFLMDRERLHQVFLNLMKNAMEAMPRGGNLKISVSRREQIAILRFQDEGTGIPEEDLPHIFEAYYTTKQEGSGLGLMTVFNALREHGGRIEVASKIGRGTTFTLLIPIRKPKLQITQEIARG